MSLVLLKAYFLAAMLWWTPLSEHAYYEARTVTETRYTEIAQTIAEVVLAERMSDSEKIKVGVIMVSIGDAESNWNEAVVSCSRGGDHGRAWGPWQTQLPKEDVCVSTTSALRLALGMVKRSFLLCKELPAADRLSWYTDGGQWNRSAESRTRAARRSRQRMNRALAWVASHPLEVQ